MPRGRFEASIAAAETGTRAGRWAWVGGRGVGTVAARWRGWCGAGLEER